jgi:hypothetical protein
MIPIGTIPRSHDGMPDAAGRNPAQVLGFEYRYTLHFLVGNLIGDYCNWPQSKVRLAHESVQHRESHGPAPEQNNRVAPPVELRSNLSD